MDCRGSLGMLGTATIGLVADSTGRAEAALRQPGHNDETQMGCAASLMGEFIVKILVVDVGKTHVRILASGQETFREFAAGPSLTPEEMVSGVLKAAEGWEYDLISISYPGPVLRGKPASEPLDLGPGWVGFDFEAAFGYSACGVGKLDESDGWVGFDFKAAFGCLVKLINDVEMQALGSYEGGKLLFLSLGTDLGSTMIVDGIREAMELGHLLYRKGTYGDYVGERGLKRLGRKRWRRYVADVVARLSDALEPDYMVLGGENVHMLKELPPGCRAGDNANSFRGGFRLWEEVGERRASAPQTTTGG
jgi:polyphosphate glucokinase